MNPRKPLDHMHCLPLNIFKLLVPSAPRNKRINVAWNLQTSFCFPTLFKATTFLISISKEYQPSLKLPAITLKHSKLVRPLTTYHIKGKGSLPFQTKIKPKEGNGITWDVLKFKKRCSNVTSYKMLLLMRSLDSWLKYVVTIDNYQNNDIDYLHLRNNGVSTLWSYCWSWRMKIVTPFWRTIIEKNNKKVSGDP